MQGADHPLGPGRALRLVPSPPQAAEPALPPLVSVVVPVLDERENLEPLLGRLRATLDGMRLGYEIVVVDDGSRDGSGALLERLAERHDDLQLCAHASTRGQSAALATGLERATGEWVLTLDADLQNPPEEIPRLFAGGLDCDIVYGRRLARRDGWSKRAASRLANAVRNAITGHHVADTGCALKLMRRSALERVPLFRGAHRFLPTLFAGHGFSGREVAVAHAPRVAGRSKYGLSDRAFSGLLDCFAVRWLLSRAIDRSGEIRS